LTSAGALGLLLASMARTGRQAVGRPAVRLTLALPDALVSPRGLATQLAVSPDGRNVAFTAQAGAEPPRLWVRAFDTAAPRSIPGTEEATGPFWSPDSGHIAFFAGSKLKRVSVDGGVVQTICDVEAATGAGSSRESMGTWSAAGTIVFGIGEPGQRLFRVPAGGGEVVPVPRLEPGDRGHSRPEFLGDDRHFAFAANAGARDAEVYVGGLDDFARTLLKRGSGGSPRYVAPDHLVFVRERLLVTQRFDPTRFVLRGTPEVVANDLPL